MYGSEPLQNKNPKNNYKSPGEDYSKSYKVNVLPWQGQIINFIFYTTDKSVDNGGLVTITISKES